MAPKTAFIPTTKVGNLRFEIGDDGELKGVKQLYAELPSEVEEKTNTLEENEELVAKKEALEWTKVFGFKLSADPEPSD